jgi:hypothetical protein
MTEAMCRSGAQQAEPPHAQVLPRIRLFGPGRRGTDRICASHEHLRADGVQRRQERAEPIVLPELKHHITGQLGGIGAAGCQPDLADRLAGQGLVQQRVAARVAGQRDPDSPHGHISLAVWSCRQFHGAAVPLRTCFRLVTAL